MRLIRKDLTGHITTDIVLRVPPPSPRTH